ncbi:MAG: hypothetical protein R3A79_05910 [Nannocystaceae bacterium]
MARRAWRAGAPLLLAACTYAGDGESATEPDSGDTQDSAANTTTAGGATGPAEVTTDAVITTTTTTDVSTTDDTTTTGDTTTGDTEDTTTTDDVTTGAPTTTGNTKSCKKVDFLFAVDNSTYMTEAYNPLGDMVPHFASRIEDEFSDWDYHMMVVKGDESWGNELCEERCSLYGSCGDYMPDYPCDYDPVECDMTLGAGIRHPAGNWSANDECPIAGGKRYITNEQPDLGDTLDCMRKVGLGHDGMRRQVQSVLDAVGVDLNDGGGCNEDFYREDAYLVVMMVTSQGDYFTDGTPEQWADSLLAHKGGKFNKVFMVGLYDDGYYGGSSCADVGWDSKSLWSFVDEFYNSTSGSMCEDDYKPYIDEALDFLLEDCEE